MRKFGAILLSAVMIASMAACGAAQPQQVSSAAELLRTDLQNDRDPVP